MLDVTCAYREWSGGAVGRTFSSGEIWRKLLVRFVLARLEACRQVFDNVVVRCAVRQFVLRLLS